MKSRHLLSLHALSQDELEEILALSAQVHAHPEAYRSALAGKTLAMIFQKSSTRTRVSFEVAMVQTGGHAIFLSAADLQLGRGESLADTARVLSRYVNGIMARVYAHSDLETLAELSSVPVINGLSDRLHPCQAICDYYTMRRHFGSLAGLKVAYLGDGNNVAHSLAFGAAKLGVDLTLVTPPGDYAPCAEILATARKDAAATGARITLTHDPKEGVAGARVVYTDVWTSMGQEAEQQQRLRELAAYQVNGALFAQAAPDAVFMHCLPAHRGEEVTADVADHPRSLIFDQAENRLHTQKAVLLLLLGG